MAYKKIISYYQNVKFSGQNQIILLDKAVLSAILIKQIALTGTTAGSNAWEDERALSSMSQELPLHSSQWMPRSLLRLGGFSLLKRQDYIPVLPKPPDLRSVSSSSGTSCHSIGSYLFKTIWAILSPFIISKSAGPWFIRITFSSPL